MAFFYDLLFGNVVNQAINPQHTDIILLLTSRLAACNLCNEMMHNILEGINRDVILNRIAPGVNVTRFNIAFVYLESDLTFQRSTADFGIVNNVIAGFGVNEYL